jgi:hypothetical protein
MVLSKDGGSRQSESVTRLGLGLNDTKLMGNIYRRVVGLKVAALPSPNLANHINLIPCYVIGPPENRTEKPF